MSVDLPAPQIIPGPIRQAVDQRNRAPSRPGHGFPEPAHVIRVRRGAARACRRSWSDPVPPLASAGGTLQRARRAFASYLPPDKRRSVKRPCLLSPTGSESCASLVTKGVSRTGVPNSANVTRPYSFRPRRRKGSTMQGVRHGGLRPERLRKGTPRPGTPTRPVQEDASVSALRELGAMGSSPHSSRVRRGGRSRNFAR